MPASASILTARQLLASLLLLLAFIAKGVSAQSLNSDELRARAWKAYAAYESHDETAGKVLIAELRDAVSLHQAPADGEEFAYVQALFDALIQLGANVPPDVVFPFRKERPAEVLLLLALDAGNEDALLAMMDEPLNAAEWLAACNLLAKQQSQRFFRKTLSQLRITHAIQAADPNAGLALRDAVLIGVPPDEHRFPWGFPPIALYQLDFPQMGQAGRSDEVLAFPGPHDVYCRRKVIQTGGQEEWGEPRFFPRLDRYRSDYLSALTGRSPGASGRGFLHEQCYSLAKCPTVRR